MYKLKDMIKVELKTINLNKSKIKQMEYISIPKNDQYDVLGWVNLDKKKYVLVKSNNKYYRAEYVTLVEKILKPQQVKNFDGTYKIVNLHRIICKTYNSGTLHYSSNIDDNKNLENYNCLLRFKKEIDKSEQIYY